MIRRVLPPISAFGFLTNSLSTGSLASNTRLKNPTIISSQLWSPHVTSLVGSAFSGLFGELSKCAVQSILVPFGSAIGCSRLYQFCQCQSKRGTLRRMSVLPEGNTARYSKSFPRPCMCGCRLASLTSVPTSKLASTRQFASPGGILNVLLTADTVRTRSFGGCLAEITP